VKLFRLFQAPDAHGLAANENPEPFSLSRKLFAGNDLGLKTTDRTAAVN
jgi:hypothetical protein